MERKGSRTSRVARTTAGVVLVAGGSVLLLLPGPGLLMIGAGLALMPGGRRTLDRARAVVVPRARDAAQLVGRWLEQQSPRGSRAR